MTLVRLVFYDCCRISPFDMEQKRIFCLFPVRAHRLDASDQFAMCVVAPDTKDTHSMLVKKSELLLLHPSPVDGRRGGGEEREGETKREEMFLLVFLLLKKTFASAVTARHFFFVLLLSLNWFICKKYHGIETNLFTSPSSSSSPV